MEILTRVTVKFHLLLLVIKGVGGIIFEQLYIFNSLWKKVPEGLKNVQKLLFKK